MEKLVQDPVEHRVKLQKKRQWTTPAVTEIFIEEGRISTAAAVEGYGSMQWKSGIEQVRNTRTMWGFWN